MKLTATDLLHGAIYATENAGHLLRDAVTLYGQCRYSSAVVLAVFCREELGRHKILLDIRKHALASEPVSVKSVKEQCKKHVEKLRRGQAGITMRCGPEYRDKLNGLFAHPQSHEYKEAHRIVEEMTERKARREPQEAHEKRLHALYVEPGETKRKWNRPSDVSKEEACQLLEDIANDYSVRLNRLQVGDKELAAAIAQWPECPPFPEPLWPARSPGIS